jgi:hypothetical protein
MEELGLFLSTLVKFNEGEPLRKEFVKRIEDYFIFKWSHDRLLAFNDDDGKFMLDQLPFDVQYRIFTEFLYLEFLEKYRCTF